MQTRNSRIGMVLFVIYLVLYGGFVFLNAFAADLMERRPIGGVNLAILCGFALIIAAFVLAMIYGLSCDSADQPQAEEVDER